MASISQCACSVKPGIRSGMLPCWTLVCSRDSARPSSNGMHLPVATSRRACSAGPSAHPRPLPSLPPYPCCGRAAAMRASMASISAVAASRRACSAGAERAQRAHARPLAQHAAGVALRSASVAARRAHSAPSGYRVRFRCLHDFEPARGGWSRCGPPASPARRAHSAPFQGIGLGLGSFMNTSLACGG